MKETKELAIGLLTVASLIAVALKDGAQLSDVGAILAKVNADPVLKAKIEAAYKDINLVKDEVKVVTAQEALELAAALLPEIQNLLATIKQ